MYFDARLWALTLGLRGRIFGAAGLGLLATFVGILRFVFLGRVLALTLGHRPLVEIGQAALATALCVMARAWLDHFRTVIAQGTAGRVQSALRARLFDKIAELGAAWFGAKRTGGVMLSVVDGVEQLQTFFGAYLPQLVIATGAPLLIFAVLSWWDIPTATVLLAAALATMLLPMIVQRADARISMNRIRDFKAFGEEFLDGIQGLPTLKAFGQSAAFGARLAAKARALSNSTFWVLAMGLLTRFFTDLGTTLGASGAVALGVWRVRHGEMSLEALLIILMAGTEVFRPLRDLRSLLHEGMMGKSAAQGIYALLDAHSDAPRSGAPLSAALSSDIAFENVVFAYPGRRGNTHTSLNFSIRAGETVAVVGSSGAGKSTILRLLLRQHDVQGGAVRIGGRDLRTLHPDQIRGMIAIVSQDTTLFAGAVADNLRLGAPEASDAQMIAAAEAANAHDFIMTLPHGYQTLVGERGTSFSGGQRQRIAIARALLRNAPILVLDEALSSVDAENEAIIQQALDRLTTGRTTLVLAHRLSSVIGADRILVLDGGRIVESGTHQDLMQRSVIYQQLMGPQLATAPSTQLLEPRAAGTATARRANGAEVRSLADDAEQLGWRATLQMLLRFIEPWRLKISLSILCGVGRVSSFIGVGVLGSLVVAALTSGTATRGLLIALLAAAPMAATFHWLESWLAHDIAYRLLAELRIALFAKLDRLAPAYLLRRRSGDLVALATQDVETVEFFYAHTVGPAFVAVIIPMLVLGVLVWIAWPLAVILLPFLAWAALAPVLVRGKIDTLAGQARGALGQLSAHLTESIQGLAELAAFQAIDRRRGTFLQDALAYQTKRTALLADLSRQAAAFEVATGLGILAVTALGAVLTLHGWFSQQWLPLAALISGAAFTPIAEISQAARQLADTLASTKRLLVIEREPEPVVDGALPMPAVPENVAFQEVRFAYPGRTEPALQGVSFNIQRGATVALVGSSGAGKSTIANLLLRFWDPQSGSLSVGAVDLRRIALDDLRRHIALVAQDTYLFNDTLEANIRLAGTEASAADLQRAVEAAALTDFVERLPQGLATRVGERGVQLSGGQRQRIAIARAFLKGAPILILDEATSHLDTLSEQQVRRALDTLMARRTCLVIAHRLSTVRTADLILVIEAGRVVESGTHAELLAAGGAYSRLLAHQANAASAARNG